MAKNKEARQEFINQDGVEDWNPDFFKVLSEQEAVDILSKGSPHVKRSTVISVWKQANGKSKPNPKTEGESKD